MPLHRAAAFASLAASYSICRTERAPSAFWFPFARKIEKVSQESPPYRIKKITGAIERAPHAQETRAQKLLEIGLRFHEQGNLPEAELIYREVLRQDFDSADAWHLLGVVVYQSGYYDVALELVGEAVALEPDDPLYQNSLGNVYRCLDDLEVALACYDKALRARPDYVEAHYNRAGVLRAQERLDEAVDAYRTALRLQPDAFDVLNDLAGTLRRQGDSQAALACYRTALELKPDNAELHVNLGRALEDAGAVDEAIAAYRRAVEVDPDLTEARTSLAAALEHPGRLQEYGQPVGKSHRERQ